MQGDNRNRIKWEEIEQHFHQESTSLFGFVETYFQGATQPPIDYVWEYVIEKVDKERVVELKPFLK